LDKREILKVESGASAYLAKPVDIDQLFPPMRVWTDDRRHRKASLASAAV
jgi:ActR/RegA family two-component response regulator